MNKIGLLVVLFAFMVIHKCPGQGAAGEKELPIKVAFRKSNVNDSLVAQFTNTSPDVFLTAVLTFKNSTFNEAKQRKLSVGPWKTVEVGWAQGWKFMTGETISIQSDGYAVVSVKVP